MERRRAIRHPARWQPGSRPGDAAPRAGGRRRGARRPHGGTTAKSRGLIPIRVRAAAFVLAGILALGSPPPVTGPARAAELWPGRPAVAPLEPDPAGPVLAPPAPAGPGPGSVPAGSPGGAVPVPPGAAGPAVPAAGAGTGGAPGGTAGGPGSSAGGAAVPRSQPAGREPAGGARFAGAPGAAYPVPEGVAPLWRGVVEPPPALDAAAAVLMDAASGQVLWAHNPHQRRAPASTTKILTAIVALEYGNLDDTVTVSEYAASTEGSTMDLSAGERYTLRELLWGLMLESGNDAAVAIAEHISGSEAAFARLMNETALRLGLRDTHFTNPHGLHDPGHYTTAYDLAVMTRYALANDYFARLVCQPEKVLCRGDGDWVRILSSTNRLLWYREWIRGVKTGTTNAAGPCLVSSGERDGRRLIAVVLDSGDRWADSERLLEWGFRAFQPVDGGRRGQVVGRVAVHDGSRRAVAARLDGDLSALVPPAVAGRVRRVVQLVRTVPAPVAPGQRLGTVSLELDGVVLAARPAVATTAVPLAPWWWRWLPG
ncbi:Serine-type D-Ala-D-Ala carboxypeptidase [Thermaerobacter marianensis DSM 12885]|uniref:serine-type D-Ala-D-Ala carboxypeptidase n=1 Tax=Thermaerobacter marianensis (strain ATCC 700841 / DSM 12885 / JCM 10246 / 7p75a) TaxID=644966 RepID=E6SK25_THEM7|nr:D-alanyl-D-alanine carboxypeptidase family protein [Thermaerobacter marianensis]ADU51166.1 Serine-type D-Ala-D-Ala carboxypeptidase [Thermaerobacter marianensis DSM 12885]